MYEPRHEKLLPFRRYLARQLRHTAVALGMVGGSLAIGMLGYHLIAGLSWVDAFLNASMILTGMGPVALLQTDAAKIFAGLYALFSGLIFLVSTGILSAPLLHRILHRFRLDLDERPAARPHHPRQPD
jgi:hypothetical protein